MWATRVLLKERQPMIKFLGRRSVPKNVDHTPHAHPASPEHSLPESFASYRNRATQHGPLGGQQQSSSGAQGGLQQKTASDSFGAPQMQPYGEIGGRSGRQLGSTQPEKGEFFDRDDLPARFRRRPFSEAEIDAVDSAGASLWG